MSLENHKDRNDLTVITMRTPFPIIKMRALELRSSFAVTLPRQILLLIIVAVCWSCNSPGPNAEPIKDIPKNTLVAFAGGTNIANMQIDSHLETLLVAAYPGKQLRFRNLGWEGDTVFEQARDIGFGTWTENFDSLGVGLVFVQFGQMEALQGTEALGAFMEKYRNLLKGIERKGRVIVLMSPIPFEPFKLDSSRLPLGKNPLSGIQMEPWLDSIALMAEANGYVFLDLYHPLLAAKQTPVTYDGIHLNKEGQQYMASLVMQALGSTVRYSPEMERLRHSVAEKNRLWFSYWRPGNWAFLHGNRTQVQFSRHWKDYDKRIFPEEMKQFEPLILAAEDSIRRQAKSLSAAYDQ